jgi:hypothetical protein
LKVEVVVFWVIIQCIFIVTKFSLELAASIIRLGRCKEQRPPKLCKHLSLSVRIKDLTLPHFSYKKKTVWPESASDLYRPSYRRLSAKLVPTYADKGVPCSQRGGSPTTVISVCSSEPLLFLSSSSSVVFTRLIEPRSRPTTQKIWWRRESNPDLWICSQELCSLDHRGGLLSST